MKQARQSRPARRTARRFRYEGGTDDANEPVSTPPLWFDGVRRASYSPLESRRDVDVVVVGGGITGLTTALLLARGGQEVVLLERMRVGSGTSGATSAHLTEVLDLRYRALAKRFGEKTGRLTVSRAGGALAWVAQLVAAEQIKCDFSRVSGYLFAENADELGALEDEARAAERLGQNCTLTRDVPLPWEVAGAVEFPDQAVFHPVRYLVALAALAADAGVAVHEHTPVTQYEEAGDGRIRIQTLSATVRARHLVLATHTPIGFALVQTEVAPYRSYLIARESAPGFPPGLFWDTADPYHYLRRVEAGGAGLVLVGGADHKTGHEHDPAARFAEIEAYCEPRLGAGPVLRAWSAQLYEPADGLPYVGPVVGSDRVYVATGLSGTGLVFGTAAAMELAAIVGGAQRDNPFHARRLRVAAAPRFVSENVDVAVQWLGDRLAGGDRHTLADVTRGDGAIVRIAGKRRAVFHSGDGTLHVFSPVCTHMGCHVRWNPVERSWDCPCHGGRFAPTGEVLEGPPLQALRRELSPAEARMEFERGRSSNEKPPVAKEAPAGESLDHSDDEPASPASGERR